MYTRIHASLRNRPEARAASEILSRCVHCGFCTATCPTYLELGDERDGPRGRIDLLKQLLEEGRSTSKTRAHLDRCLSCGSCETTCPSGVQYGRLLDIGRAVAEQQAPRSFLERSLRQTLRWILPHRRRFAFLLRLGQMVRPLAPRALKTQIPKRQRPTPWPAGGHNRKMLVLAGCVQPGTSPNTNAAAARVLHRLGIELLEAPAAGCCGAISYHLGAHPEGLELMRRNIDAWQAAISAGVEAIIMTASGCGSLVKQYGYLLRNDARYAAQAAQVSGLTKDLIEVLQAEDLTPLRFRDDGRKTVLHCPCSLYHGQRLPHNVKAVFDKLGIPLTREPEQHLCCGSAGTYSLLQPKLGQTLLRHKLRALMGEAPDRIVTANVGCQLHLGTRAEVPVLHWIELLDELLLAPCPADPQGSSSAPISRRR